MSTFALRQKLLEIARRDVGKTEDTKNRAPWIKKLWGTTSYPEGYEERAPYCAAGLAYCVREWLKLSTVRAAFGFNEEQAEKWRCKSAAAFGWTEWAKDKGVQILPVNSILHAGDIAVYSFSHIEIVSDDDGTTKGPFVAIGYNSNAAGARDGEGCFEKPRSRKSVREFIRMLP